MTFKNVESCRRITDLFQINKNLQHHNQCWWIPWCLKLNVSGREIIPENLELSLTSFKLHQKKLQPYAQKQRQAGNLLCWGKLPSGSTENYWKWEDNFWMLMFLDEWGRVVSPDKIASEWVFPKTRARFREDSQIDFKWMLSPGLHPSSTYYSWTKIDFLKKSPAEGQQNILHVWSFI